MNKGIVRVLSGDIAQVGSDALITAINSGGAWFGGIDGVIARSAGQMFHTQAAAAMPLQDGQTVVAKGQSPYNGKFSNVVFVVDDLQRPLREIILFGLQSAEDAGFKSVTLPTIRMGVMLGVVEKDMDEAIAEMVEGVRAFVEDIEDTPQNVQSITFVIYQDPPAEILLRTALGTAGLLAQD